MATEMLFKFISRKCTTCHHRLHDHEVEEEAYSDSIGNAKEYYGKCNIKNCNCNIFRD
jgi:hypothetical protein